jgi:molybdate transport system regulatory protein
VTKNNTNLLHVRVRIDFGPASSIGPGKMALLEHIDSSGSLSQAARELGMSYRRAWLLLDDLNHTFSEPVATAVAGGTGGGGATLTAFGKKLIESFRDIEHEASEAARKHLAWLPGHAVAQKPITSTSRRPLAQSIAKENAKAGKRARAARRS